MVLQGLVVLSRPEFLCFHVMKLTKCFEERLVSCCEGAKYRLLDSSGRMSYARLKIP